MFGERRLPCRVPPERAGPCGLQRLFPDRKSYLLYFRRLGAKLYRHLNPSAYPFGTWKCRCSSLFDTAKRTLFTCHRSCPAFLMPYRMFPGLFPLLSIRSGTEIRHIGTHPGNIGCTPLGNQSLFHPLHIYDALKPNSLQEIFIFFVKTVNGIALIR